MRIHEIERTDTTYLKNERGKMDNTKTLRFRTFPAKTNDSIFRKIPKTQFWAHFPRKPENCVRTGFLLKIRAVSLFYIYCHLTSYKISENKLMSQFWVEPLIATSSLQRSPPYSDRPQTSGAYFPKWGSTSICSPYNALTFSEETRKN